MVESQTANSERGACRKCGEQIGADVLECPECEHSPYQAVMGLGLSMMTIGGVLTIFLITAIVGIPMVIIGVAIAAGGWLWKPKPVDPETVGSETGDVIKQRDYGSLKAHLVVAGLTAWWTLGLGNASYAVYRYLFKYEEKQATAPTDAD